MTEQTLHNIGSTSKQFLAFGLLLLQEQGELSLDDDVRKHIPELPEFEHTITLRNIVNHTSGYREFLNTIVMTGRNASTDLSQEKVIEIVQRQPELQNEPGAEFNYNNTGYVLATEVMERVTETPFPKWMEENVFKPIGMNHTVVRSSPKQVVERRSTGYSMGEEGQYVQETDLGGAMGAGGIHSTMEDLAKWIDNLLNPTVGTPEMIKEMTTPFTLKNGTSTQYGLGLFIQEYKGLKYFHHGGADVAHRSMLMVFPEINAAVVTQSNNAAFNGSISTQVAEAFFAEHMEQQGSTPEDESEEVESPEEFVYDVTGFEALTGRYELSIAPGFILTFSRDEDRIYTQATGQPEIDIKATSDSTFSLVGVPASVTFHRNEDGTADSLTLHQNGNHIAKKIAFELSFNDMKEYTGRYFSDEIETLYTLAIEDSSLVLKNYQFEDAIELSAGNTDSFSGGFPIAEISFERDESGKITGFNASNGRTRGVFFAKWD
jgi:CubicO group peptidase (beta-lactamase class C family)